ncbi:hypothetical protein CPSG_09776 [Coccidioides posadasii str. Silveira]|uniref:Uncharacterized protein n=1 Tax=Coccidioides posadasii (strain RMSCC 757 / Silveira) TaxID=443226 RepID=E9DIX7_COCPS|nr:hypothetical protein CPSG_09776 [Coccidioides posadasii str. Silveira]
MVEKMVQRDLPCEQDVGRGGTNTAESHPRRIVGKRRWFVMSPPKRNKFHGRRHVETSINTAHSHLVCALCRYGALDLPISRRIDRCLLQSPRKLLFAMGRRPGSWAFVRVSGQPHPTTKTAYGRHIRWCTCISYIHGCQLFLTKTCDDCETDCRRDSCR